MASTFYCELLGFRRTALSEGRLRSAGMLIAVLACRSTKTLVGSTYQQQRSLFSAWRRLAVAELVAWDNRTRDFILRLERHERSELLLHGCAPYRNPTLIQKPRAFRNPRRDLSKRAQWDAIFSSALRDPVIRHCAGKNLPRDFQRNQVAVWSAADRAHQHEGTSLSFWLLAFGFLLCC